MFNLCVWHCMHHKSLSSANVWLHILYSLVYGYGGHLSRAIQCLLQYAKAVTETTTMLMIRQPWRDSSFYFKQPLATLQLPMYQYCIQPRICSSIQMHTSACSLILVLLKHPYVHQIKLTKLSATQMKHNYSIIPNRYIHDFDCSIYIVPTIL